MHRYNATMLLPLLLANDWSLVYERSGFTETGRYQEAVEYCRRLAKASPYARVVEYGVSPQGRGMVALVVSRDRTFDPAAMAKSTKPTIFIQNGIHSGEIEGKDASLIMFRDMLIRGKDADLLQGANFVMVPIYSVDAHERFSPYNRINQNGPREMGWRATAQNYNLNRDWMKADAPETRAEVALVHRYRPDFFFDNHTTDGADFPYVMTLGLPISPYLPPASMNWSRTYYQAIKREMDSKGFLTAPYFGLRDASDPSKGIDVDDYSPRYSNGYWSALNRPSVLVETHVLKPYAQRVNATLALMRRTVAYCIRNGASLKYLNRAADRAELAGRPFSVLSVKHTETWSPLTFLSHPYTPYKSDVSGGMTPKWDRSQIVPIASRVYDHYDPQFTATPPAAYAIPPEWSDVIDRIRLHGLAYRVLKRPLTGDFEGYRFSNVTFPTTPFEGRFQPRYTVKATREMRVLPVGTVIVPTRQVGAKLLMHLMEPEGPDSLARWGFFNNVFEAKEYYDEYAMEPVAVEMLRKDAALKAEFDEKLRQDAAFAGNPAARLRWLYERSPYFDDHLNRYPVVRLREADLRAVD